jgi:hypothetical protein
MARCRDPDAPGKAEFEKQIPVAAREWFQPQNALKLRRFFSPFSSV